MTNLQSIHDRIALGLDAARTRADLKQAILANGEFQAYINGLGGTSTPVSTSSAPVPVALIPSDPVNLVAANLTTVTGLSISGDTGIVAANNVHTERLEVLDVKIRSTNYSLYHGDCDSALLRHLDARASGGGNDYCVRGTFRQWDSRDCQFRNSGANKAVWRVYGCLSGTSIRDVFEGARMMLGGGYANEWDTPGPFQNFLFADGFIRVPSIEIYGATKDVTFRNMDFAGTNHITLWDGSQRTIFQGCKNLPQIRADLTKSSYQIIA